VRRRCASLLLFAAASCTTCRLQKRALHPPAESRSLLKCVASLTPTKDSVVAVSWSPAHPDLVATGGQDDRAFLWRVGQDALEQTGGTLATYELTGHTDTIVSLAFNSTGTLLATGGLDATVRVWSAADGGCLRALEGPADDVHWVVWHPKGDVVLAGSEDFSVWMWLGRSGDCMQVRAWGLGAGMGRVWTWAGSEGRGLCYPHPHPHPPGTNPTAHPPLTEQISPQVFSGHRGPVTAGAFTSDGKSIVTVGGEGDASLRVWNPKTGECTLTVSGHPFHEEGITCLALQGAGDAGAALTGGQDGSVRVTNTHNGRVLAAPAGRLDFGGRRLAMRCVVMWCVVL